MELVEKKKELKKHVGTIDISNPISLLQWRAFSILYYNAYHDLKNADGAIREIPLNAFCELMGYNSKNFSYLDEHIKKLQTTIIEWRNNPDEFERVTFFSYTAIKDGMFRYSFHPKLEKKIYNPDRYARINILTVSQFTTRYALVLYEHLAMYRPNKSKGFQGGSPKWTLDEFRDLMGVSEIPSYQGFRELNRRILTPAVKEINEVSDLHVSVEKIKKGRSIHALKFHIEDNPQQNFGFIPEPETAEKEVKNPLVVEMYELYGVPLMKGAEWLIQHGDDRFSQVMDMVGKAVNIGNLKNPIGYITKAFEEGWTQGKTATEAREHLKKQKAEKKKEVAAKKRAEEKKQKDALEKKKQDTIHAVYQYIENLSQKELKTLYSDFHDDMGGDWFGKKLPFEKGEDPLVCENKQIEYLFLDFVAQERLHLETVIS